MACPRHRCTPKGMEMDKHQGYRLKLGVAFAACLGARGLRSGRRVFERLFLRRQQHRRGHLQPVIRFEHRFTTKPGTVSAENIGAAYGKQVTAAYTAYTETPSLWALRSTATATISQSVRAHQCRTNQPRSREPALGDHAGQPVPGTGAMESRALYGSRRRERTFYQFNGGTHCPDRRRPWRRRRTISRRW